MFLNRYFLQRNRKVGQLAARENRLRIETNVVIELKRLDLLNEICYFLVLLTERECSKILKKVWGDEIIFTPKTV
jgi:hypothetical protein